MNQVAGDQLTVTVDRYVSMNRASRAKNNMTEARQMMEQARLLRKKRDVDFLERMAAEKARNCS